MNNLHYKRTGDPSKPTVIFLHGFMGDRRDWQTTTDAISEGYDCVAVDLPGHGQSVGKGYTYDFASAATSIIEIADDVGADSFSLVGYSLGGRLALYFASMYAMRIDTLILESASPGLPTEPERAARRKHDEHSPATSNPSHLDNSSTRGTHNPCLHRCVSTKIASPHYADAASNKTPRNSRITSSPWAPAHNRRFGKTYPIITSQRYSS